MRFSAHIVVLSAGVLALGACGGGGGSVGAAADGGSGADATSLSDSGSDSARADSAVASDAGSDSAPAGGAAPCDGGAFFDPTEVARVAGWLSNKSSGLEGYAYTNIDASFPVGAARTRLVDSIVGACAAFAPRLANWREYCEAIVTSEIVSESSYEPGSPIPGPPSTTSVNYDAYATMNGHDDPTVGLLQVRFSSTVHDYNYYGSIATIEAIGCSWPAAFASETDSSAFWTTQGGTVTYLTFMEDPACNIPLAAWYVFMNATGNGGPNAVYAADYCGGHGIAGNVVDGLLSYLEGPGFPRPADPTNSYPAGIKTRFVALLGGTLPSPDPFGVTLSPNTCPFCK
jgi:hypothetical protein